MTKKPGHQVRSDFIMDKLYTIFIFLIIVFGLSAVVVGAAGATVTADASGSNATSESTDFPLDADDSFETAQSLRYQGAELYVKVNTSGYDDFRLIEYEQGESNFRDATGSPVRALTFNNNGSRVINTDSLINGYAITASNGSVRVAIETNESGIQTGTTRDVSDEPWLEIVSQDIDAQFKDDTITLGNSSILSVEGGRAGYDINISSNKLTGQEMSALFDGASTIDSETAQVTDISEDEDIEFNTSDASTIEPGSYTFELSPNDASTTSDALINISSDISNENLTMTGEIENDGRAYSLGFPGRINGTLADVFDTQQPGYSIFVLENGQWEQVSDPESVEMSPLESVVIATENGSGQPDQFRFSVEFKQRSSVSSPPQRGLRQGWNFVSAPRFDSANKMFDIDGAFLILNPFKQPDSVQFQQLQSFSSHYIGSDANQLSPFQGYFLYMEQQNTLPGVLNNVQTRNDIVEQLNINPFNPTSEDSTSSQSASTNSRGSKVSNPPSIPANYYGSVQIDGEPAPQGTTITALIDGEARGQLTVDEAGKYGGPRLSDKKLTVKGDPAEAGDEVGFRIKNEAVGTIETKTVDSWNSGVIHQVNLTGTVVEPPSTPTPTATETGGPGLGGAGGGGGGGGGSGDGSEVSTPSPSDTVSSTPQSAPPETATPTDSISNTEAEPPAVEGSQTPTTTAVSSPQQEETDGDGSGPGVVAIIISLLITVLFYRRQ